MFLLERKSKSVCGLKVDSLSEWMTIGLSIEFLRNIYLYNSIRISSVK